MFCIGICYCFLGLKQLWKSLEAAASYASEAVHHTPQTQQQILIEDSGNAFVVGGSNAFCKATNNKPPGVLYRNLLLFPRRQANLNLAKAEMAIQYGSEGLVILIRLRP